MMHRAIASSSLQRRAMGTGKNGAERMQPCLPPPGLPCQLSYSQERAQANVVSSRRSLLRSRSSARPHDQFRFNCYGLRIGLVAWRSDSLQQRLCRNHAHLAKRLADRGQRRVLERGALNIVKADDGYILWNAQARLAQHADRANRRNIVERK